MQDSFYQGETSQDRTGGHQRAMAEQREFNRGKANESTGQEGTVMEYQGVHETHPDRGKGKNIRVPMPQVDSEPVKQKDRPHYRQAGLLRHT